MLRPSARRSSPVGFVASLLVTSCFVAACSSGSEAVNEEPQDTAGSAGAAGSAGKSGAAGKAGAAGKGGTSGTGGTGGTGGTSGTGGTGGSSGTGGTNAAGKGGSAGTAQAGGGGTSAGGTNAGGSATGGTSAGGSATGGTNAGGSATGGTSAGGTNAGGSATGGTSAGGTNAGGSATGGTSAGGTNAGGSATGGTSAGGASAGAAGEAGAAGAGGTGPVDPVPCALDSECASGHCIEGTEGKKICAVVCKDSCDDPLFRCAFVVPVNGSAYEICVPRYAELCRPCDLDSQCRFPDDTLDKSRCVPNGNAGSFCATDCTTTSCAAGYACEEKSLPNGQTMKACVPTNGDLCQCKDFWAGRGYKTTCGNANAFGTCKGARSCDTGVLSGCDAKVAALEVCDGIDSDCDNTVDDNVDCDDGLPCTVDSCAPSASGGAKCESTIKANACKIGFACVAAGEANPNNPCQVCDPTRSQSAWSDDDGKACDDGEVCTSGSVCGGGACLRGTTVTKDAYEDNNSIGGARTIDAINDGTAQFSKSLNATLPINTDQDWYKFSYSDPTNLNSTSPTIRLTAPAIAGVDYRLETYFVCSGGNGVNPKCTGSTDFTDANGRGCKGTTGTGSGSVTVKYNDFDCTSTNDEGGTMIVHVFAAPGSLPVCASYKLEWGDD